METRTNLYQNKEDGYYYHVLGSGRHTITHEKLTYYYGNDGEIIAIPMETFKHLFEQVESTEQTCD